MASLPLLFRPPSPPDAGTSSGDPISDVASISIQIRVPECLGATDVVVPCTRKTSCALLKQLIFKVRPALSVFSLKAPPSFVMFSQSASHILDVIMKHQRIGNKV